MRATRVPYRLLPVVLLAFAVACGGGHGGTYNGGDGGTSGGTDGGTTQTGSRRLSVVGNPLVQLQVGGTAHLAVGLVQDNLGPVSGETVTFSIAGAAQGATLSAQTATTDAQGTATVDLTAGTSQTTFQVKASAPGADPVAFGVQIIKLTQTIAIIRTPSVTPDSSSTSAAVQTAMKAKVSLKVRISDQFGNPMTGLPVHFGFVQGQTPLSATIMNSGAAPTTGPGGQATATLDTGSDLNDSFTVTARTDSSATVQWQVTISGAGIKLCKADSDCPAQEMCDTTTGMCAPLPACSNDPTNPVSCPQGYQCLNNECAPAYTVGCATNADCGPGFTCDTGTGTCTASNPECSNDGDCQNGYTCKGGTCLPPNVPVPDISGSWYTAHTFHIGDAVPVLPDIAGPIRTIDRLFLGDLGLPSWLQGLIAKAVNQFVPDWFQKLVHVLDVVATFTHDLRSRGYMDITQSTKSDGSPAPAWTATEQWSSFVFYDLELCDPIPADPTPACARVDLMVDDPVTIANLGLKVHPFAGTINGAVSPPQIVVNDRTVDVHIGKLIGWLADQLVSLLTPYSSVQEAIVNAVDCSAVNTTVGNLTGGFFGDITALCQSAVKAAADQVSKMLYNLAFDLGALKFHGTANITADSSSPPWATDLGDPSFEQKDDGHYDGTFVKVFKGFKGQWYASRDPLP